MQLYKYIGRNPETLSTGRPLAAHDLVEIDLAHHHDRWLVDSGRLIPIDTDGELTGKALDARCKELNIDGWSSMTADQKRAAVKTAEKNIDTGDDQ